MFSFNLAEMNDKVVPKALELRKRRQMFVTAEPLLEHAAELAAELPSRSSWETSRSSVYSVASGLRRRTTEEGFDWYLQLKE
jgi:hypothetical protein